MKKIILSLFTIAALSSNAQDLGFAKGNIALTGTAGYSSSDNGATTATTNSSFRIAPEAMYMIQSNIGLKAGLGYMSNSSKTGSVSSDYSGFGFGVGANYYFMKGQFSPFLGLGIGYNMGTSSTSPATTDIKTNILNIGLTPGINYFVAKNWALSASIGSLGYTSTSNTAGSAASVTSSNIDFGFDLTSTSFGVSYIFK